MLLLIQGVVSEELELIFYLILRVVFVNGYGGREDVFDDEKYVIPKKSLILDLMKKIIVSTCHDNEYTVLLVMTTKLGILKINYNRKQKWQEIGILVTTVHQTEKGTNPMYHSKI